MKYIPLNVKTEYDLMNSLIKLDDLFSFAKENNLSSIGITSSNLFNVIDFINKCNTLNVKPIVGLEIYLDNDKLLLYAKNYEGFVNLCKIVSKKNIESLNTAYVKENNNGIIGVLSNQIYNKYKDNFLYTFISYSNEDEKEESLMLSEDVVYLFEINYLYEQDKNYFKYIKLIDESKTIDDIVNYNGNYYKENTSTFDIKTTYKFANIIDLKIPNSKLHIPVYKENSTIFLRALSKKGLNKRLNNIVPIEYKERLEYELSVIEKMNYVDYFLIVYDFILFAKKNNILVGPGRGSGAASLVNYALGIINIDPLKYNLIFERFLNPDRISMPDIDIDFDSLKREEVIDYVINKYGELNTARIISFNTMNPKQIIRDLGRVMKIENIIIDSLCKTIKDEKDFESLKSNSEYMSFIKRNSSIKDLINISSKLCGLKKNTSIHAAGVVISDTILSELMPLYKNENMILTGYSMEYIESLGLLKMDFLSIKNLNTISNIINEIHLINKNFNINEIPLDDYETIQIFNKAYTTGIFQFESSGMKSFLKNLEVDSFNILVDAIALYRPGPREMIGEYIARKKGIKKVTYIIKELESILQSTYGIIIYQEQVLEILRNIGGYSYSEADVIRRAMSKKKYDVINSTKIKFVCGVKDRGYSEEVANQLFDLIIKFSSYGFNKSHSVVYSLVAFQMAYLKAHYTQYFMKNLLNMNSSNEKIKEYIDESRVLGIKFSMIDINISSKEFILVNGKLILPFTIIKSIAYTVSEEIINERNNGLFKSFYDFMIRCYGKSINSRIVISLIESNAFNEFNVNQKMLVENMDEIINYVSLCRDLNTPLDEVPVFNEIDDYNDSEKINNEIKNYGFYLSFNPVVKYDRSNAITLDNFKKYFDKTITTVLFLENIKLIRTKNNENMAFITLSDEYDKVEGVIFPSYYSKLNEIEKNKVYKINANVERRNNSFQLIIYNMIKLN